MTDELREAARRAIESGAVPRHRAERTWGGLGTGASCAVCSAKIARHEVELEVEVFVEGARPRALFMHQRCYSAWEAERRRMDAPEEEHP